MTDWQAFYHIDSDQSDVHRRLNEVVCKHQSQSFMKPISVLQRSLFDTVISGAGSNIILDCGCGTGMSSRILSQQFPQATVIGIDQSRSRLTKEPIFRQRLDPYVACQGNLILVQADVVAWWQLIAEKGLHIQQACFYYPNPWPKAKHLQRRWHGHAIWPLICKWSGQMVMRTNWRIYAEEWQQALRCCRRHGSIQVVEDTPPLSLFEQKYRLRGIACYEVLMNAGWR